MGSLSILEKSSLAKPRVNVSGGNSLSGWLSVIGFKSKAKLGTHSE